MKYKHVPRIIRDSVKERDSYKCVFCGKSKNLVVHHLIPWSFNPNQDIRDLSNFITVCNGRTPYFPQGCHKSIEKYTLNLLEGIFPLHKLINTGLWFKKRFAFTSKAKIGKINKNRRIHKSLDTWVYSHRKKIKNGGKKEYENQ